MLFFYLFLFSITLLGSFAIGPFTIRVYMTVFMIIYLIVNRKEKGNNRNAYPIPNSFISLFVSFIIIAIIALTLNGELFAYGFPKLLLSRYIPCIVAFFAFDHFITSPERCKQTFLVLSIFIVFNCVVSLFQFYGNPLGLRIALLLTNVAENETNIMENGGRSDLAVFGVNSVVGLFHHTFGNAMYIASLGILLAGFMNRSQVAIKIILFSIIIIVVYACMTTQGRAPFIMLVLMLLILFLRSPHALGVKVVGIALVVYAIITYVPLMIESEAMGRISNQDIYQEDVRQNIWRDCLLFLQDHLFLGAPYSYNQTGADPPHNYFLNSLIISGLLGGIIATIMYVKVMYEAIIVFIKKESSMLLLSAAASIIIYQVNSLFHNASIITADTLFFLIYPLFYKIRLMKL